LPDAIEQLRKRCEVAGLDCTVEKGDPAREDSALLIVNFLREEAAYDIWIEDGPPANRLLDEPFEEYMWVEGFEAVWSPSQKVVECSVRESVLPPSWLPRPKREEVLDKLGVNVDAKTDPDPQRRVEFGSEAGLSVSIGPCSNTHGIFNFPEFGEHDVENIGPYRAVTLRIEGAEMATENDAIELLNRVADSVFFQLDLSMELPLALVRDWYLNGHGRSHKKSKPTDSFSPIRYEYDRQPMSLYWYAKAAAEMPLLQYLAYYQVLEFYFPTYSEFEAQKILRNVLKDPTFDPMRDSDVARLLGALRGSSGGRSNWREVDQLEATIRHCVNADDLRNFLISESEYRYKFYTSDRAKKIVRDRLPVREKSDDHRGAVAKRVYAIRNRIVHTKGGLEDLAPLFPLDPETGYLNHDIDLVEFLARRVLITSSRPFKR
jgi:hypothetical protein